MPRPAFRSRDAFTLIELLVVIAIIAILIALLVPAVQKVREAAARLQCQNNMKQLGLALHNFENTNRGFPMAPYNPSFAWIKNKPYAVPHGWTVQILPYLEQENIRSAYNFNAAWDSAANANIISTVVPNFACPSVPGYTDGTARGIPNGRAPLDYIAFFSVDTANTYVKPLPPADQTGQGIMGRGVNRRITEITDGTSNTLLLVEDGGRNQVWINGKQYPAAPGNPLTAGGAWANCCLGGSVNWFYGFDLATNNYYGPCAVNCVNASQIYSFHSGGANVLMGDGSVHFLHDTANINTVVSLLTRSGGEIIASNTID
jgi:prepilin-type N-terminal cleavage/methylation domain-containing protein/prepilin-type processing-associated H-X9-DG protein